MIELQLPKKLDVLIVLGSLSDQPFVEQMVPVFADFGVKAHFEVCSAHRDHERLGVLIPAAEKTGAKLFIAVAGKAAHLPGVMAALTVRPVIGVPVESGMLGLDALLSIAQMPPGIPVASVGVGGGRNAALLAVEMLGMADPGLRRKLASFRRKQRQRNRADSAKLQDGLK